MIAVLNLEMTMTRPSISCRRWKAATVCRKVFLCKISALVLGLAGAQISTASPEEDVMFAAARAGNVALFRAMVKAGADPNAKDLSGSNALVFAAMSDREEMVKEALTYHPDVDARGSEGMTALAIATLHNAPRTVALLLRAGADTNIGDSSGITPLSTALRFSRRDLALRLIEAGADPNTRDLEGETPLHIVSERGDAEMTISLLKLGADPNVLDAESRTPLFLALFNHQPDVAEVLIRRRQTNLALVTQGYTPAYWARQMGYERLARSIAARLIHDG